MWHSISGYLIGIAIPTSVFIVVQSISCLTLWHSMNCSMPGFPFLHYLPESESHSVLSDSLWPHGLYSPWNSQGQNTGVGSLSLTPGDLPNTGIEPSLPHCRQILYQPSHKGSPDYRNLCPPSQWCIQPSHPLLPSSPLALNFSSHQVLFQWVSSLHSRWG